MHLNENTFTVSEFSNFTILDKKSFGKIRIIKAPEKFEPTTFNFKIAQLNFELYICGTCVSDEILRMEER